METFIFIYAKENKIKVINLTESNLHNGLIAEGWVHTQTLDACGYIQFLHNDCKEVDLIDEIKSLSKKENHENNS